MEKFSIQQTSKLLKLSKDTLRYYDKIGLIRPSRGENKYRYYTEEDVLTLKYIEVLKYANFTLEEIQQFFEYKSMHDMEGGSGIKVLLEDKRLEYKQKIKVYQTMDALMDKTLKFKEKLTSKDDISKIDNLVEDLFQEIKGG